MRREAQQELELIEPISELPDLVRQVLLRPHRRSEHQIDVEAVYAGGLGLGPLEKAVQRLSVQCGDVARVIGRVAAGRGGRKPARSGRETRRPPPRAR